jgi:hypothetical protein
VDNPAPYRQSLTQMLSQHPELCPTGMEQGFTLHDRDASVTQDLLVRRMTVQATGAVFTLRPSLVMPSMIARTAEVEKALSLRQWGVPCDALASVCGRDALCWSRAWLAFGRPALLGTTVKDLAQRPTTLVAEEKGPWVAGQAVDVPTTVGAGCFLGVRVVAAAETTTLEAGYGACAREAQALVPDSPPRSVCTDGWQATREAGRRLLPQITLGRCLLHAVLTSKDRGTGALRPQVLERVWHVSQATTTRQCAQRLRRVAEWTPTHRSGAVAAMGLQRCRRRADVTPA